MEPRPEPTTATWQSSNFTTLRDKPIRKMVLPGSHNSGSNSISVSKYGIGPFSPVPTCLGFFFERWSICQECDIATQLLMGIRYIDLRVSKHHITKELHTEHTVYGEPLIGLLNQINNFITTHEGEMVVLFLNNFRGADLTTVEDHEPVIELLESVFISHESIAVKPDEFDLPLGTLKARNRSLCILYANEDVVKHHLSTSRISILSPSKTLLDKWFNASSTTTLFKSITDFLPAMREESARITVLQAILSPRPLTTVCGFLVLLPRLLFCFLFKCAFVPQNLGMMADKVNKQTGNFIEEQSNFKPSVVLIDGLPGLGAKGVIKATLALNSIIIDKNGKGESEIDLENRLKSPS